jgi:hypothetical protein
VEVLGIVKDLAKEMKYAVNSSLGDKSVMLDDYSAEGNFIRHLQNLAEASGLHIWAHADVIYVKERTAAIRRKPHKVEENEIIASPAITDIGVDVKVRLNPSLLVGQEISLASKNFPRLNAQSYVISALRHKGNTRGGEWMSELSCVRKGLSEIIK